MKIYPHEQRTERDQAVINTVWPMMSTNGIDTNDVKAYMASRGLSWELAESNGWYPTRNTRDNFLRIVIPAVSTLKGHVYWQARAVSKNVHLRYQTPRGPRNGALIYVLAYPEDPVEERGSDNVVIVEGPMDALAAAECGSDGIALMGMNPGDEALEHLFKLVAKRNALVVLDSEPEAQRAASLIALLLASKGSNAHVEALRNVKDLAAMKKQNRQIWIDRHMEGL